MLIRGKDLLAHSVICTVIADNKQLFVYKMYQILKLNDQWAYIDYEKARKAKIILKAFTIRAHKQISPWHYYAKLK